MGMVLKSSELRGLSLIEKRRAFKRFLESAPAVDSAKRIRELKSQIRNFERQTGMSTRKILDCLCSGELPDAGRYAAWREAYMTLRAHEANVRASA